MPCHAILYCTVLYYIMTSNTCYAVAQEFLLFSLNCLPDWSSSTHPLFIAIQCISNPAPSVQFIQHLFRESVWRCPCRFDRSHVVCTLACTMFPTIINSNIDFFKNYFSLFRFFSFRPSGVRGWRRVRWILPRPPRQEIALHFQVH